MTAGSKLAQTVSNFSTISSKTHPSSPFSIIAPTASSGLPVTVTVKSGPATISGGTVTLTGTGTVVLAANQSGNSTYDAAPEVTTFFSVAASSIADSDSDGVNNNRELYDGTDPNNPSSFRPLSVGLVAHYPLNNSLNDVSGRGNHGALFTPSSIINGEVESLSFTNDGRGDSTGAVNLSLGAIRCAGLDYLDNYPITLTARFKLFGLVSTVGTFGGFMTLVGAEERSVSGEGALAVFTRAGITNKLSYVKFFGGDVYASPVTPNTNQWSRVTLTISTNRTATFYVDGTQVNQSVISNALSSAAPFMIGTKGGESGASLNHSRNRWNGLADDVRVYDRALSSAEVAALEAPTIVLKGANPTTVFKGATFIDPQATVTDDVDSPRDLSGSGTVNTSMVGAYQVIYDARDSAGNAAPTVVRTVYVVLDPNGDEDGDGLINQVETNTGNYGGPQNTGTDPFKQDTNGDGVLDGEAVSTGINPNVDHRTIIDFVRNASAVNPSRFQLFTQVQYDGNRAAGRSDVLSDPPSYNLYTTNSILDLSMGGLMFQKSGSNAMVVFQPQTTTDLGVQPFTNNGTPVTNQILMPGTKGFIRIRANPTP